jgi:DNA mismatch repair protein MutS
MLELEKATTLVHELDVSVGFADLAEQHNYTKPVVDDSCVLSWLLKLLGSDGTHRHELIIEGGRHPVVEQVVEQKGSMYQPTGLRMKHDESRFLVVTGPNMCVCSILPKWLPSHLKARGGKSTNLRQAALIVLLAQAGSFVPADYAHVGIVDRIFTRIGAQDNLASGQSTFMLEMRELGQILEGATSRSLVRFCNFPSC